MILKLEPETRYSHKTFMKALKLTIYSRSHGSSSLWRTAVPMFWGDSTQKVGYGLLGLCLQLLFSSNLQVPSTAALSALGVFSSRSI